MVASPETARGARDAHTVYVQVQVRPVVLRAHVRPGSGRQGRRRYECVRAPGIVIKRQLARGCWSEGPCIDVSGRLHVPETVYGRTQADRICEIWIIDPGLEREPTRPPVELKLRGCELRARSRERY